jgi:hypothetical protein
MNIDTENTEAISMTEAAQDHTQFSQAEIIDLMQRGIRNGALSAAKSRKAAMTKDEMNQFRHIEKERAQRRAANKAARKSRKKNR